MVNLLFTMVTLLQVKYYLKTLYKLSMNKHFYIQSKIFNILDFYGLLFWIVVLSLTIVYHLFFIVSSFYSQWNTSLKLQSLNYKVSHKNYFRIYNHMIV